MTFARMRLGKGAAAAPTNAPTLDARHRLMVRQAPQRLDRAHINPHAALDANDRLGDCTAVAVANTARAQAAVFLQAQVPIVTSDVISLYSRTTGYDPHEPSTDQGGIESDVLSYVAGTGFTAAAEQVPLVGLWGSVDHSDLNGLRNVTAWLGSAYLGVALATADQATGVWDTTTPGDQTPGSWGGHALVLFDYAGTADADLVTLLTWGTRQRATWRWLRSRMDEAHALVFPQLMRAEMPYLDWQRLRADNAAYLAGA